MPQVEVRWGALVQDARMATPRDYDADGRQLPAAVQGQLRGALGDATFKTILRRSARLDVDQALAYAMEETAWETCVTFGRPASHPAGPFRHGGCNRKNGKEITMDARLNFIGNTVAANVAKYINSAGKVVTDSTLPAATQELVKIRASQINGCAYCTDMHTKDAAHAGETSVRLNLVAAWREAKVFTDAERAALELTEQGTRIADAATGVTDEAWANAAKHYDDDQLAALISLIALINAYNRMNVIIQQPAGDYQSGQWG
jgi:AhpD family alkylhydroperoxidase